MISYYRDRKKGKGTFSPPLAVSYLVFRTYGALVHHARVRDVGAQQEIHAPALGPTGWRLDGGGFDAKDGSHLHILTLQLSTHGIAAEDTGGAVVGGVVAIKGTLGSYIAGETV